jgi:hypothetical protein
MYRMNQGTNDSQTFGGFENFEGAIELPSICNP